MRNTWDRVVGVRELGPVHWLRSKPAAGWQLVVCDLEEFVHDSRFAKSARAMTRPLGIRLATPLALWEGFAVMEILLARHPRPSL